MPVSSEALASDGLRANHEGGCKAPYASVPVPNHCRHQKSGIIVGL